MKPLTRMGLLPRFEHAYREVGTRVSPVKYDNLASVAAGMELIAVLGNSHLTVDASAVGVPTNSGPKLLWQGYAAALRA